MTDGLVTADIKLASPDWEMRFQVARITGAYCAQGTAAPGSKSFERDRGRDGAGNRDARGENFLLQRVRGLLPSVGADFGGRSSVYCGVGRIAAGTSPVTGQDAFRGRGEPFGRGGPARKAAPTKSLVSRRLSRVRLGIFPPGDSMSVPGRRSLLNLSRSTHHLPRVPGHNTGQILPRPGPRSRSGRLGCR